MAAVLSRFVRGWTLTKMMRKEGIFKKI